MLLESNVELFHSDGNDKKTRNSKRSFVVVLCVVVTILSLAYSIPLLRFQRPGVSVVPSPFPYTPILRYASSVDDVPRFPVPKHDRNQVAVVGTVMPARTVVIDHQGTIREIWSNTAAGFHYYSLEVREGSRQGPLTDYSPVVHRQYAPLIPLIDWRPTGKVYAFENGQLPLVAFAP